MSEILTKFSERKRRFTPSGTRYENLYQEEIEKKSGRKHLIKVGETCVYDKIQEDLEASKIENIIHKLAMGDLSVLREAKLTYVDEEEYPHSLMEAQNIVVKAKSEFDKFPAEVKEIFHNSPEEYVSEIGTKEFFEKMSPYNDEIKKHKKEEADAAFASEVEEAIKFNRAVQDGLKGDNE